MPKFNQLIEKKYLSKEDFERPALVTIVRYEQHNVAMEGQPQEMKWVIYFRELPKGLILNPTNVELLKMATKCYDDTDATIGKQIVLFNDPTVSMGGKLTGGIRIRAPRNVAPPPIAPLPIQQPAPPPAPTTTMPTEGAAEDDVPF